MTRNDANEIARIDQSSLGNYDFTIFFIFFLPFPLLSFTLLFWHARNLRTVRSRENSTGLSRLYRFTRGERSLFIAYIASTRPTVINPNPFNMQIPAPPTARGLLSCFLFFFFCLFSFSFFFHHERVSIANVIRTATDDDRASSAILRRIRYYL